MKSRFKILVVVMAVMGLMAVSASSASALQWRANGSALTVNETVSGTNTNPATSQRVEWILISGVIKIECRRVTITGRLLGNTNPPRLDNVIFKFEHCTVYLEGVPGICSVVEPIVTKEVKGTVSDAGEFTETVYTPEEGEIFVTLEFAGEECPIGGFEVDVSGTGCGEGADALIANENVTQLQTTSPEIEEGCGTELFFGEEPATLEGPAWVKLSGAKAGQKWGVN